VATLTGNAYLLVGCLVFGLGTGVLGLFLPGGKVFRRMARGWGRTTLWMGGIRFSSRFETDPSALGRCILMPNHQSLYDIPLLLATLPAETRFLAKESLFRIPIFGWALRTGGFIPVRRGDRRQARQAFQAAIEGLGEGASILIFPEETRTPDGRLLPFKRGGFLMALRSGLPVVPVGIRGNFEVRPKGSWLIRPGRVEVHYGRPVASDGYDIHDMGRFVDGVRGEVARLAGLEATARDGE
jgi:1-acyl-sn-glycerol-3-phosphate acyltransferase